MKRRVVCLVVGFLLSGLSMAAQTSGSSTAPAQVPPPLVNFSGVLTDVNGKPLTSVVGVTFALYQEQQGGSPLWLETQNVTPNSAGRYTAALGSATSRGIPANLFATGAVDAANKYLYHSFVESPDMMNIYNGNVTTDGPGSGDGATTGVV